MEPTQYRSQVLSDILETKEKHGYAPLIMVEWKSKVREDHVWWSSEPRQHEITGLPSGYVLLTEPTCRQVELYGMLKRTMPAAAADQIVPRHVAIDRIGLDQYLRAGIMHALLDVLTRWSSTEPTLLNPMLEHERSINNPLSDFILSHIYSIDPSFSEQNLATLTYSQLLHKLYAVERTLSVATGGSAQLFQLVTPEMIREQQRAAEKSRLDRIFQSAAEEEAPPPPPPTAEEMRLRETQRQTERIRMAPPVKREFR